MHLYIQIYKYRYGVHIDIHLNNTRLILKYQNEINDFSLITTMTVFLKFFRGSISSKTQGLVLALLRNYSKQTCTGLYRVQRIKSELAAYKDKHFQLCYHFSPYYECIFNMFLLYLLFNKLLSIICKTIETFFIIKLYSFYVT